MTDNILKMVLIALTFFILGLVMSSLIGSFGETWNPITTPGDTISLDTPLVEAGGTEVLEIPPTREFPKIYDTHIGLPSQNPPSEISYVPVEFKNFPAASMGASSIVEAAPDQRISTAYTAVLPTYSAVLPAYSAKFPTYSAVLPIYPVPRPTYYSVALPTYSAAPNQAITGVQAAPNQAIIGVQAAPNQAITGVQAAPNQVSSSSSISGSSFSGVSQSSSSSISGSSFSGVSQSSSSSVSGSSFSGVSQSSSSSVYR